MTEPGEMQAGPERRVVFHTGFMKTGTTFLQRSVFPTRADSALGGKSSGGLGHTLLSASDNCFDPPRMLLRGALGQRIGAIVSEDSRAGVMALHAGNSRRREKRLQPGLKDACYQ